MTRDQIIAWAREAMLAVWHKDLQRWTIDPSVERFAQLVAEAEREACAKVCEAGMDQSTEERMKSKSVQLNGADGELEALKFWSTVSLYNNARRLCAVAIRERK